MQLPKYAKPEYNIYISYLWFWGHFMDNIVKNTLKMNSILI